MSGSILVTCRQMQVELPAHRERIEAAGYTLQAPALHGQQFASIDLQPLMPGVVGMIAGDDELDRAFFAGSSDLRVLVRWGIGMDSVDHDAARQHRVEVRNTPGVFGREVADAAMALLLASARGTTQVDRDVRAGRWTKFEGITLDRQRVGIVGAGVIGRAIQHRAAAFGCETIFSDPFADSERLDAPLVALEELLRTSRFIVLACPLTAETLHLIDEAALSLVRADAFIVNVARGPVVDEAALVAALAEERLAGAALDVFEIEPLPMSSRLRSLPGVVLGAHNGSNTREGVAAASARAVDILLEELGA